MVIDAIRGDRIEEKQRDKARQLVGRLVRATNGYEVKVYDAGLIDEALSKEIRAR